MTFLFTNVSFRSAKDNVYTSGLKCLSPFGPSASNLLLSGLNDALYGLMQY